MSDPTFLDVEDVVAIHEEQLPRYGGAPGIRDPALLESAVAMPRATAGGAFVHEGLFANKRTGLLAALVFLDLNGVALANPEGRLYDAMIAIAERRLDKAGLAAVLRELAERT